MLFVASAIFAAIIATDEAMPSELLKSATFAFARALAFNIMNVYVIKMVGVFIALTSTLALRTGFVAREIAFLGYAPGAGPSIWKFSVRPESCNLPLVGASDQRLHPHRQFPSRPYAACRKSNRITGAPTLGMVCHPRLTRLSPLRPGRRAIAVTPDQPSL
jgi:hypothetical protein